MKQFLAVAFLAAATTLSAAQVNLSCAGQSANVPPTSGGPVAVTCSAGSLPVPAVGFQIIYNFAQLTIVYDITQGVPAGNAGSATFTHDVLGTDLNFFDDATPQLVDQTTQPVQYTIVDNAPTGAALAAIVAGTTINGSYASVSGNVESVSWDYAWTIDYTERLIDTGVPEPATMAMFGAGLLALGLFRRK